MTPASHARALELVAPHCDLVERLRDVPPSARVRGLYLKTSLQTLQRLGLLSAYESYFPDERWTALAHYPAGDYLLRLAVAGALVASPARLHDGMREVSRSNAVAFSTSLLGRVLLRFLAQDPVRLAEQGIAARRQTVNYGQWTLVRHGPRDLEMVYREEYVWIESAIAGAAAGTFEACREKAMLSTTLVDRYHGSTRIRW